jgi:hypothetical protein
VFSKWVIIGVLIFTEASYGLQTGAKNASTPQNQNKQRTKPPEPNPPPSTPVPCCVSQPAREPVPERKPDNGPYLQRAFAPESLVNWLLFGVGALGVGFAWKTLRTLVKQTEATKIAADAALLNAKAILKSERPWVIGIVEEGTFELGRYNEVPKFWLGIRNTGRTAGKLTRILLKFEKRASLDGLQGIEHDLDAACICPLPFVLIVPKDHAFKIPATIAGELPITLQESKAIGSGSLFLVAYGVIEYEDTFENPGRHTSGFFFKYVVTDSAHHGFQICLSGPSDYLQMT